MSWGRFRFSIFDLFDSWIVNCISAEAFRRNIFFAGLGNFGYFLFVGGVESRTILSFLMDLMVLVEGTQNGNERKTIRI